MRNDGPSDATGVVLRDFLPPELTPVSATPTQGTCETPVSCTLGAIPAGGAAQVVVVASSDASLAGRTVTNAAAALAEEKDSDLANNSDSAPVTFVAPPPLPADVVVTKTASRQTVNVGDTLTYTVTARNRGPGRRRERGHHRHPAPVARARLRGAEPGTCTPAVPVSCNLGTLAAGASATVVVTARVLDAGALPNGVTAITSTTTTTPPADRVDVAGIIAQSGPRVGLRKRALAARGPLRRHGHVDADGHRARARDRPQHQRLRSPAARLHRRVPGRCGPAQTAAGAGHRRARGGIVAIAAARHARALGRVADAADERRDARVRRSGAPVRPCPRGDRAAGSAVHRLNVPAAICRNRCVSGVLRRRRESGPPCVPGTRRPAGRPRPPAPPHGALVSRDPADADVEGLRQSWIVTASGSALRLYPVPDRMLRQTALRRDRHVLPVVLDAHERRLAQLAGLVPARRHHDDRQARVAQRVGPPAAGGLVLRDLLAHPTVRTRPVPSAAISREMTKTMTSVNDAPLTPARLSLDPPFVLRVWGRAGLGIGGWGQLRPSAGAGPPM